MPETRAATLSLTVDGHPVSALPGQSVLEACRAAGVRVPTLCHHPRLEPFGGCRLCIVEIEGMRGYPTSCTTSAADGMVVTTENETLRSMRRTLVELLLSDHDIDCLVCEMNGACELQDLAYDLHADPARYAGERHAVATADTEPLIARDLAKCVACGRCVRVCAEVQGVGVYGYRGRGFGVLPDTPYGVPLGDAGCERCGQCVDVCPVGALTDRLSRFSGRTWETETVESVCGYCGVGCTVAYRVRDGRIVGASAPPDRGVNRGSLCAKGRYGWRFTHHPDRLTRPLVRRDGELVEVGWDEALAYVAERLRDIVAAHGPDAVGGLASAKCTTEEDYLFQRFMRTAVGTNNVDHCARL